MILLASNLIAIILFAKIYTNKCGVNLQEFHITDKSLDSTVNNALHGLKEDAIKYCVTTLELNVKNDSIDIVVTFHNTKYNEQNDISDYYIGVYNKRLLGYIQKGKNDIILFTNINYAENVWERLGKMIKPSKNYKCFNYIYHSNKPYKYWNSGYIYEPIRYHFIYYNGRVYKFKGYHGMDNYETAN